MWRGTSFSPSDIRVTIHQVKLKVKHLPPIGRLAAILGTLVFVYLLYRLGVYLFITDLSYHTETEKCPACFGTRMCQRIHETSVHGIQKLHHINWLTNVKNVYFGKLHGMEFVYKKLAHGNELNDIDIFICNGGLKKCGVGFENHDLCVSPKSIIDSGSCDFPAASQVIIDAVPGPITAAAVTGMNDVLMCPSQRLVNRIVERYQERSVFRHSDGLDDHDKFMLLYTLAVNPEPIVLQTFPAGEGWPFPHYIGACGRMMAVEHAGQPLRNYFYSDWPTRVNLSLSLLRIADQLTDNSSGFKLYFSDISLDNYVVDDHLNVIIADAENVIVVDEQELSLSQGFDDAYSAPYDECPVGRNCLSIDQYSLCRHARSDFNYYAVCRSLLSRHAQDEEGANGGLLHSPPFDGISQTLVKLADECAKPPEGKDRLTVKTQLISELELAIKKMATTR